MQIYYTLLVFTFILLILFTLFRYYEYKKTALLFKALTSSFVLIISIYLSFISNQYFPALLITLGSIFGLLGDFFLELKVIYPNNKKFYLQTGFIVFIIGHFLYIISIMLLYKGDYLILYSLISLLASSLFSFLLIKNSKKLKLNFINYKIISSLYCTILSFGLLISFVLFLNNSSYLIIFIGYLFFTLSDLILSAEYFGTKEDNKLFAIVNHLFYYAAQLLIVSSMFVHIFL